MATVLDTTKRRGTLRDLKTAVTARIRSKPTIEGQRYLDLYVLQRDRFRWLRLIQQAERSIHSIDMALQKIGFPPTFGNAEQTSCGSADAGGAVRAARKTTAIRVKAA